MRLSVLMQIHEHVSPNLISRFFGITQKPVDGRKRGFDALGVDLEQSVAEVATGRRRPAFARLVGRQRRYSAPLLWDLPSGDAPELTQFGRRNGQLRNNGPHLL